MVKKLEIKAPSEGMKKNQSEYHQNWKERKERKDMKKNQTEHHQFWRDIKLKQNNCENKNQRLSTISSE